ncbi:MAG: extracellular solute-binding protein, partial [Clostridia bacterium]|nr:extracellular solute-binding protein [Clostridia bacterium]
INFAQTYARLLNPEIDVKNDSLIMTPMLPLEGPYGHRYYRGNDPIAGYFAINKNCENPEAVFSFLDYIFSEEANSLMFYGLEDEDYEVIDGKIVPDLEKRTTDNYANRMGNNFGGFPRILLAAHRDVSFMPEIAVYNKQIHEYNKLPDVLTSFFLPDEIEVIQQYDTDIITYFNEMLVSFVTGETDLSTFDDYVATAESMGLSQLLEAYQSRYERTKAAGN